MNKRRSPMTEDEERRLLDLDAQGMTSREMGAQLGVKPGTIRQRLTVLRRRKGEAPSRPAARTTGTTPAAPSRTTTPEKSAPAARRGRGAPVRPDALTRTAEHQVVYLRSDLRRRLKAAAYLEGVTASELVSKALEAWFETHPVKL